YSTATAPRRYIRRHGHGGVVDHGCESQVYGCRKLHLCIQSFSRIFERQRFVHRISHSSEEQWDLFRDSGYDWNGWKSYTVKLDDPEPGGVTEFRDRRV